MLGFLFAEGRREPAYAATKAKSVAVTENNNNEMQANALAEALLAP